MLRNAKIVCKSYYKLVIILVLLVTDNVRANDATVGNYFGNLSQSQESQFFDYIEYFRLQGTIKNWYEYSKDPLLEAKAVFITNLVLINYYSNYITTAKFGVNMYTGITFDKFIQGYTGFNSTGLTDEGVVEFDPQNAERIPIEMDWTGSLTSYQMEYCKNSYVYSALSKYCIFYILS